MSEHQSKSEHMIIARAEVLRLQEHCKMLDHHLGIALSALRQFEREQGQEFDSRGEVEAIEEEWGRRTVSLVLAQEEERAKK
jgi:hypothetical protein